MLLSNQRSGVCRLESPCNHRAQGGVGLGEPCLLDYLIDPKRDLDHLEAHFYPTAVERRRLMYMTR